MNSAISPTELLQANTVCDAQLPLVAGADTGSGEGTKMLFLQESSLDPLVVT